MLKKCVLVTSKELRNERQRDSSFKRGAMQFEDFNYQMYNPYILIEKESDEDTEEILKNTGNGDQKLVLSRTSLNLAKSAAYSFGDMPVQLFNDVQEPDLSNIVMNTEEDEEKKM